MPRVFLTPRKLRTISQQSRNKITADSLTHWLACCVSHLASRISRYRTAICTGGHPMKTQRDALKQGVDVVVGTPGRLAELAASGCLEYGRCSHVVLDEADVLLGPASTFAEQVVPIKDVCAANESPTKFVLVTATLPADIYADIEYLFPGIVSALGPGLHRTAPGCVEQIIDCSGGDEINEESGIQRKCAALLGSLQEQKKRRTIVFCNKIETCRKVENFLNRSMPVSGDGEGDGFEVLPYHAAIAPMARDKNLAAFLRVPGSSDGGHRRNDRRSDRKNDGHDRSRKTEEEGEPRLILVCTDRASRGVDSAYVRLYFLSTRLHPWTPDYLLLSLSLSRFLTSSALLLSPSPG